MLLQCRASATARDPARFFEFAQLDERLDQIRRHRKDARLLDSHALRVRPDVAEARGRSSMDRGRAVLPSRGPATLRAGPSRHRSRPPGRSHPPPIAPPRRAAPAPRPGANGTARTSARPGDRARTGSAHSSSRRAASAHAPARSSSSHTWSRASAYETDSPRSSAVESIGQSSARASSSRPRQTNCWPATRSGEPRRYETASDTIPKRALRSSIGRPRRLRTQARE